MKDQLHGYDTLENDISSFISSLTTLYQQLVGTKCLFDDPIPAVSSLTVAVNGTCLFDDLYQLRVPIISTAACPDPIESTELPKDCHVSF